MHVKYDIGAYLKVHDLFVSALVAGGTGDDTEVTTQSVDTLGWGSFKFVILAHSNNTADKVLNVKTIKVEYSADDSAWDAATTLSASETLCTGTGDKYGSYEYDSSLLGKKRYVRFLYTPDLTADDTDVAEVASLLILGGGDVSPG